MQVVIDDQDKLEFESNFDQMTEYSAIQFGRVGDSFVGGNVFGIDD